jgi:hypothetical protein
MEISEIIIAYGHKNVLATHNSTLEVTKEAELSERGNCIIAVSADKSLTDLKPQFRASLQRKNVQIRMLIEADGVVEMVTARGSPRLTLRHPTDMVVRKSNYVCARTLAIQADKAAYDLSRRLVEKLKNPRQKVQISLTVKA